MKNSSKDYLLNKKTHHQNLHLESKLKGFVLNHGLLLSCKSQRLDFGSQKGKINLQKFSIAKAKSNCKHIQIEKLQTTMIADAKQTATGNNGLPNQQQQVAIKAS